MELEIGSFPVTAIAFGSPPHWEEGTLVIDRERVRELVLMDPRVHAVTIDIVAPGEDVRIIHPRDVIPPRVKVRGSGHVYPGICGHPIDTVGTGATFAYEGFGVLICSEALPHIRRTIGGATDSLIDMLGPGAVTVYSTLRYLVLTIETEPHLEVVGWNDALQSAGHRVADDIAALLRGQTPTQSRRLAVPALDEPLPRLVYVHMLNASMEPGFGTSIYGFTPLALPIMMHPNEILDGAIAGDAVVTYPGSCTWMQVNNQALRELYARHGSDFNWVGTIVPRTRWGLLWEKQRCANQAVKLAQMLDAQVALVTWNHAGNDLIEVMLTVQGLERAGIKTVLMTTEAPDTKVVRMTAKSAETGVNEPPLLFGVPEADAIVCTGKLAPFEALPPVARVIGGAELVLDLDRPEERTPAGGPLDLEALAGTYTPIFGHFDNYGLGCQSYFDY